MKNSAESAPRFEAVTPRLPVADVDEALSFYLDQLGFQLGWKWGTPTTHASVCRDSVSLDLIATPPRQQGMAMAYLAVNGVDAYFSELQERGVQLRSEPANKPYGMRDFEVVDPCGNRLAFGEPTDS